MAWLEKRKRYRLRDEAINPETGKRERITMIRDLGLWREAAGKAKEDYEKAKAMGFRMDPTNPDLMRDIREYLLARKEGRDAARGDLAIPIPQMCDLYLEKHGPSLKGGVSNHHKSQYYNLRCRLNVIKRAWADKMSDGVNKHDVRDFLNDFTTVPTRMKYLNTISPMFRAIAEWNEDEILKPPIRIPPRNPASAWRKKMKPSQKLELPDDRVLEPKEWNQFKPHLTPRARAICEMALRRFLRPSDIRAISHLKVKSGTIRGLQAKTGEEFIVPVIAGQPEKYDFTNFRREFYNAQVAAGMNKPAGHPLHFTMRSLRRTGATWAYRKTKDLVGISRMLGHRKITTTIRYLRIDDVDRNAIAAAVDEIAISFDFGGEPVGNTSGNEKACASSATHSKH